MRTLEELVSQLQEYVDMGYGDLDVRVAHQQNWPLREEVVSITVGPEESDDHCVWLAIYPISSWSDESPYAPRWAWAGGIYGEDFDPEEY